MNGLQQNTTFARRLVSQVGAKAYEAYRLLPSARSIFCQGPQATSVVEQPDSPHNSTRARTPTNRHAKPPINRVLENTTAQITTPLAIHQNSTPVEEFKSDDPTSDPTNCTSLTKLPQGLHVEEKSIGTGDRLSSINQEVLVAFVTPYLGIEPLARFSQTSVTLHECATKSAEVQVKSLDFDKELLQLITESGITGIQIPEGPFNNSIHHLRVLTAFKDAIRVLKDNDITDINAEDIDGWTPLYLAARDGQVEIAQALITAGADVNAQNNSGYTPLHGATNNGNTEIAQALITAGADVNLADIARWTPLHMAARDGHTEITQALITAGADLNPQNNSGWTPLHWTAHRGHTDIAQALITAGADLNAQNRLEQTPLNMAAENGHTEILEALIAAVADVSTYTGTHELVLNIKQIENGEAMDSDVDLDLLTHRFMAIVKQKAMLKIKSGVQDTPTLIDICWKK